MGFERVEIGPHVLIRGDCLEVLPTLDAASFDTVLTDPPYGIDYQSAWRTDKALRKPKIANDRQPFIWWLRDASRLLASGGALLCFCRWDVQEAFRLAIGWAGLKTRAQVVWDRVAHGAGDTAGSPAPQHDLIWYATRGRRVFHGKRPKSVVRAMRLSGGALVHPNEKPASLLGALVDSYVPPDSLCLDPFMGSGTTGVACARMGRRFVGVELDPGYFDIACRRLDDAMKLAPAGVPS